MQFFVWLRPLLFVSNPVKGFPFSTQTRMICRRCKKHDIKTGNTFSSLRKACGGCCSLGCARWAIQAMLCAGITSLLVVIHPLSVLFQGSGYWAVQSAVVVIEVTRGASLKKCFERVCGTLVGGFAAYAGFVLITWNETVKDHKAAQVFLFLYVCLWPLPWGYIRVKFPNNPLIATYGTFTGYIVIISSLLRGNAVGIASLRILAVTSGVLVSTAVVHLVWPNSARTTLDEQLAELLRGIADILHPLVETEAGLIHSEHGIPESWGTGLTTLRAIAAKRRELEREKMRSMQKKCTIQRPADNMQRPSLSKKATQPSEQPHNDINVSLRNLERHATVAKTAATHDQTTGDAGPFTHQLTLPLVTGPSLASPHENDINHAAPDSQDVSLNGCYCDALLSARTLVRINEEALQQDGVSELDRRPRTSSVGSRCSSFFREQEYALEVQHAETVADVAATCKKTLHLDAEGRKLRWKATLTKFQKCHKLMTNLSGLIVAAKQEILCRYRTGRTRVGLFPDKKYSSLLVYVERLFHHIASLFFSLNLQQEQTHRARHNSITAAVALGYGYGQYLHGDYDVEATTQSSNCENVSHDVARSNLRQVEDTHTSHQLLAGVAAAFIFTDVFGALIYRILETTQAALVALATALLHHSDTLDAQRAITSAAEQTQALQRLTAERRAIYAQIFTAAAAADATGHWIERKKSDFGALNADQKYTTLPWDTLMGIEAETFRHMTKTEHELYWESHWLARDRLSVATATLILLQDQLHIILRQIQDINLCYGFNSSQTTS